MIKRFIVKTLPAGDTAIAWVSDEGFAALNETGRNMCLMLPDATEEGAVHQSDGSWSNPPVP